jgi:putative endonuclease
MYTAYILYSNNLKSFYSGSTGLTMEERLKKNLANHKGFTGKAKDWKCVFKKTFSDKKQALEEEERKIKKRGAQRYLDDLDQ